MKKKDNIQKATFYPKSPKYMVGDIVCSHGFNCIVYGIYPYCGYYSYDLKTTEGESLGKICQEDINEKLLTPAILEKNGWKAVDGKRLNFSSYEKVFISRERRPSIFMQNGKFYHDLFGKNRIDFVHQLQHLLFGLGLDSNIEL